MVNLILVRSSSRRCWLDVIALACKTLSSLLSTDSDSSAVIVLYRINSLVGVIATRSIVRTVPPMRSFVLPIIDARRNTTKKTTPTVIRAPREPHLLIIRNIRDMTPTAIDFFTNEALCLYINHQRGTPSNNACAISFGLENFPLGKKRRPVSSVLPHKTAMTVKTKSAYPTA